MKQIKLAYIGGGSKQWARVFMNDLALQSEIGGEIALYDIDYEAALRNQQIGLRINQLPDALMQWEYHVYPNIEGALRDADFVVISILPGTFTDMMSDVHEPERYGIYQPVGDTAGPGGVLRSMRTVPDYEYIAKKIELMSPNAWVINFTNPMGICLKTLYDHFPTIKAFGCCHEVFNAQNFLAAVYQKMTDEECHRTDIKTEISGINHFTWITKATFQEHDLLRILDDFMKDHFEEGICADGEPNKYLIDSFACANRVKMDLYRRYGVLGAAGDRHLVEFMNNEWYVKDLATINQWKFALTSVKFRIKRQDERIEESKKLAEGKGELVINKSTEEAINLMRAILGLGDMISNANMPNIGQTPDFPLGAIVETNCQFSKDSVKPLLAPRLPAAVNDLVLPNIKSNEKLYQGIKNRDLMMIFTAFKEQPLCCNLTEEAAKKLFNEMVHNNYKILKDNYPVLKIQ